VTDRDWVGEPVNPAEQPGTRVVLPDGTLEVHCALLRCLWVHRKPPVSRWVIPTADIADPTSLDRSITAAITERHLRIERALHDHLAGHDPVEWVTELVEARRERTDLIRSMVTTAEHAIAEEGVTRPTRDRIINRVLFGHPDGRDALDPWPPRVPR